MTTPLETAAFSHVCVDSIEVCNQTNIRHFEFFLRAVDEGIATQTSSNSFIVYQLELQNTLSPIKNSSKAF